MPADSQLNSSSSGSVSGEERDSTESRIDQVVRQHLIPRDSLGRATKVIGGDWTPYASEKTWSTYTPSNTEGDVSVGALTAVEWDWGLLRHDIHVLLHLARTAAKTPSLSYKGYDGSAEIVGGTNLLYGEVIGIRDVVTFQSRNVKGFIKAFHDSVDDYLEMCAERAEEPNRV
jgi:hypothetical protein